MTFEILPVAFGESTVSRTQVQLWYKRFKEGRKDVCDDARPNTSTIDENSEAVKKNDSNHYQREVADDVDISFSSCQAIFTIVLGIKRAATKIFPFKASRDVELMMLNNDPDLLKKIITGDESWMYGYDI